VPEPIRPHAKPLAEILLEIKNELISFVETRIRMFNAEFKETCGSLKNWMPLMATAALLLGTAYLLFTAALVALVEQIFLGHQFRWAIAFGIVGALWTIAGFIAVASARSAFRKRGSFPNKTLEILKADALWLHDEVKRTA
jgi:uncharacterized membrane protein YqjE